MKITTFIATMGLMFARSSPLGVKFVAYFTIYFFQPLLSMREVEAFIFVTDIKRLLRVSGM